MQGLQGAITMRLSYKQIVTQSKDIRDILFFRLSFSPLKLVVERDVVVVWCGMGRCTS